MYGSRPPSRAQTPLGSPMEQLDRMTFVHRQQMQREVEHAVQQVYRNDVQSTRLSMQEERRDHHVQETHSRQELASRKSQQSVMERVDRQRLTEDEVLLDRRLHEAMETKLGRLTYMREHARVERVLATTRSLLKKKQLDAERQQTLAQLMTSCSKKGVDLTHASSSSSSGTKGIPSKRVAETDAVVLSAAEQRRHDQEARQQSVDAILRHQQLQQHHSGLTHPPLHHHHQPNATQAVASYLSQSLPTTSTPGSRVQTPSRSAAQHHRPCSRQLGDDVDWGASATQPARASTPQFGPRSRATGSAGSSNIGSRSNKPRGSSGGVARLHESVSSANATRSAALPPLPDSHHFTSSTPLNEEGTHHHHKLSRDPSPEVHHMSRPASQQQHQRLVLSSEIRRPNSRGMEERRVFEKHSMRALRDMILGAGRRSSAGHMREVRPTSPLSSSDAMVSSPSAFPPTVRAASASIDISRAGISPPITNRFGELDRYEVHQTKATMDHAQHWVRLFGHRRAQLVLVPTRSPDREDEDEEEEEFAYEPPSQVVHQQESILMVDMSLPDDFERRPEGGAWIAESLQHEEEQQQQQQQPRQEQTQQHLEDQQQHYRQYCEVDREEEREQEEEQQEEAAIDNEPDNAMVEVQSRYDEMRQQLHAHHGGAGGDSPARQRHPAESGTQSVHIEQEDAQELRGPHPTAPILPLHEPDFTFDNFFAGSFEAQPIGPSSSTHVRSAHHKDSHRSGSDAMEERHRQPRDAVAADGEEDDPFPAPPTSGGRFADFGSSDDDDDDYEDDEDELTDVVVDRGGAPSSVAEEKLVEVPPQRDSEDDLDDDAYTDDDEDFDEEESDRALQDAASGREDDGLLTQPTPPLAEGPSLVEVPRQTCEEGQSSSLPPSSCAAQTILHEEEEEDCSSLPQTLIAEVVGNALAMWTAGEVSASLQ